MNDLREALIEEWRETGVIDKVVEEWRQDFFELCAKYDIDDDGFVNIEIFDDFEKEYKELKWEYMCWWKGTLGGIATERIQDNFWDFARKMYERKYKGQVDDEIKERIWDASGDIGDVLMDGKDYDVVGALVDMVDEACSKMEDISKNVEKDLEDRHFLNEVLDEEDNPYG